MKYDLIVAGGGFSGVAAAVAAARQGVSVLLIEKSGYLGGAACNNYVNPFMPYMVILNEQKQKISAGLFGEVLDRLEKKGGLHEGKRTFSEEILKLIFDDMTEEAGVEVLLHSLVCKVEKNGGKMTAVTVTGKSGDITFEADYFIDATGDCDLAVLAGCPYQLGRAKDNLCQPMTLCFRISGVDIEQFGRQNKEIQDLYKQWQAEGKTTNPRENVLVFSHMADGVLHFNTTRIVKKNPVDVFDLSKAEKEARRQMFELFTMLKENISAFKNSVLLASAPEIGVRESRKIQGDFVLDVPDLKGCTIFPDRIAACNYDIDIHNPEGSGTSHYYFGKGEYYTIPYRALIPSGVTNLLAAGRCISTTHEAQASYRIIPVCCTLGEAAGVAVAVAKQDGVTQMKQVNVQKVQEILVKQGAFIG